MSKRTMCQIVTMFLLGLGWGAFSYGLCLVGGIFFMGFLLWHIFYHFDSKSRGNLLMVVALIFFLIGAIRGQLYQEKTKAVQNFLKDATIVSFQGEISKKETKNDKTIYYLQKVTLQNQKGKIYCPSMILYPNSDEHSIGTTYVGTAQYEAFEPGRNEGNFDAKEFYLSNGVYGKLKYQKVEKVIPPKVIIFQKLYEFRNRLVRVYEKNLPGEEAGMMSAIALGEKGLLDQEAKELFRLAGFAHILAISGLHISVVGMFVYRGLRKKGLGYWLAGMIATLLVVAYGLMCGMGNSLIRALIMYLIMLLANALGEAYDSLNGLAFAALIMAGYHPGLLKNTGVWFSFMAVIGVVTVGKKMAQDFGTGGKNKIKESVGMALGIQLFTFPLVALFYYEIPVYVMVLNLVLLPFVGILLGTGLVGGLMGLWVPFAGKAILFVSHLIIFMYEWCASMSLKFPGAVQIVGAPKLWKVGVYYVLLYLVCYGKIKKEKKIFWLRRVLLLVSIGLVIFPGKKSFEIDVLDVGQGDGTFIRGENGTTFFVDGGSSDEKQVGKYRILPFLKYRGVRKIDYWFVSHTDEDHISGLMEALEMEYSIENLVFSSYVNENEGYEKLCDLAREAGTKICYMEPGDTCIAENVKWSCLYPDKSFQDSNGNSMILLLEHSDNKEETIFRGLFTGDMGMEQEKDLLAKYHLRTVDYLKVAHHGSKNSSDEAFLKAIQPRIATISCGEDNSYGHPHAETLMKLEKLHTKIYRTDFEGQIKIDSYGNVRGIRKR
ncbi:MAG: DNA internalization-related competence protein ComEC/Rec2 [Pararoseburia sp.]|nr:DNA internalization-related competence protein ComEC/Rec2 [Pararoseburia sp.]